MEKFKIVRIDSAYCDYLRKFDDKVRYNAGSKELRPFVGVLFKINDMEYFAPLSSPKEKYLNMKERRDFIKIDNGKLGVINLNNMIPVTDKNYTEINIFKEKGNYAYLLRKQYRFLFRNQLEITTKAINLYNDYNQKKLYKSIYERCCNFKLLEEKCNEYKKMSSKVYN